MVTSPSWVTVFPSGTGLPCLVPRDKILVDYERAYCRQSIPALEGHISALRESFESLHPSYDQRAYRLVGVARDSSTLRLTIGPAFYSEYIAFRQMPEALNGFSSEEAWSVLPNVIGNVGIVLTEDLRTFAVVRSNNVSTYRGYLDFPGGHPEPLRVEGRCGGEGVLIANEFYDAVVREVVEDIGVGDRDLDPPLLLAVLLNTDDVLKPDMAFLLTTSLTSQEIRDTFEKHRAKLAEVSNLVTLDPFAEEDAMSSYTMTPIMAGSLDVLRKIGSHRLRFLLEESKKARIPNGT